MLAIKGAKVITACCADSGKSWEIEQCVILVDGGKITAIGKDVPVPAGVEVIDASGMIVTPGLIDAHSHIGIMEEAVGWAGDDVNELTDPNTADVRALDGIYPADPQFAKACAGGVTCVQIGPGSGNVIGGEMLAAKTCGTIVDDMVVKRFTGMKAALGENPKRVYGSEKKRPSTRMGNAAVMRTALQKARDYMRKVEAAKAAPDKTPETDLKCEALARVLRKEPPLRVHAHRADDILTAIRIKEEFDIDISIEHCTEGHKLAGILAAKKIPCCVGPSIYQRGKLECKELGFLAPVSLAKASAYFAIITDADVLPQEYLGIQAGMAVREGMDEKTALAAITRVPAEIIGIADRVGTLEVGKDADLVVWDGDPFEYLTHAVYTIIDGKVAYSRNGGCCK